MVKILGIEFAPINIPIERRLQTLAVLYYCCEFLLIGFLSLLLLINLIFTKYYYLSILYFMWFIYDRKVCNQGGRLSVWARNWTIWRYFVNYFPLKLVKTVDLNPNKNYIFGCHPHGILCASAFGNFGTEGTGFSKLFNGLTPHILTLETQFWFPFHRELFLMSGACSATKQSMQWLLSKEDKGHVLVLLVGGAIEALDAVPNTLKLTVKRRKGFIKLALKHGASLVPVLSFGENDIFIQKERQNNSFMRKIQQLLTKYLGFSPPLFHGRGVFQYNYGFIPFRKSITTVVGEPIDITKVKNPTNEEIYELQDKYIECLKKLFNENKNKYGFNDLQLIIQ
ncbi:2-acylglycerol O-acyltransferase 1-like [Oppia nitens]|uniref:2-acylglycerol O-acyltransferase 1-like n=1 Tax=Oppia nitens TaxID=1686743 RepID=UPI0023D9B6C4|nr:2-acylglycerol O-acyltransferase 1-like [Oppia nitens]